MSTARRLEPHGLTQVADATRVRWSARLDPTDRAERGQYFTPAPVARFMASLVTPKPRVRFLDPGAGVGCLTAALVETALAWPETPTRLEAVAFESDARLLRPLRATLAACRDVCEARGVGFDATIRCEDFIDAAVGWLDCDLFGAEPLVAFDAVVMNPPYRKIRSLSRERVRLRRIGLETSNLYSAFLGLGAGLLGAGGELVAITPRSFCNGPYFQPFREWFFARMALRRVHVFDRRDRAFRDDDVLQENVVVHAARTREAGDVIVSTSEAPASTCVTIRELRGREVVDPEDPELVVRLPTDTSHRVVASTVRGLACDLPALGIAVSTGRVVGFRARPSLRALPSADTAPLVHPETFERGRVAWPRVPSRKAQAIAVTPDTEALLLPPGWYVLVKRFSAKEEPRRVVAAVYDPSVAPGQPVGFENHVNVYHCGNRGLGADIAAGLATYLNSSLVDTYFRQESGHTQVNASDLRRLRYPSPTQLRALGESAGRRALDPSDNDALVAAALRT